MWRLLEALVLLSSLHLVTMEPFKTTLGEREDAIAAVGSRLRNSTRNALVTVYQTSKVVVLSKQLETDLGWGWKCRNHLRRHSSKGMSEKELEGMVPK